MILNWTSKKKKKKKNSPIVGEFQVTIPLPKAETHLANNCLNFYDFKFKSRKLNSC